MANDITGAVRILFGADVSGLTAGIDKAVGNIEKFGQKISNTGSQFQATGLKLAALGASLSAPLIYAAKSAIDFESAFAGVRKTVELSDEGFESLRQTFLNLSKTTPVSFEELSKIGELAGQLGVKGVGGISAFTKTISLIGPTTNLTTEQAATSFARLSTILGFPIENVSNLGSAVVGLGNNFATTEQEIVNFTTRIAGSGAIAKVSVQDLAGIATAFASVGIEAESGGTAVQKVLLDMNTAVAQGGEQLDKFAMVSGMTSEDFAVNWKKNAADTFAEFVKGLGVQGDQAATTLDDLGFADVRLQRAFLSLASAGDLVTETISKSREEFEKNTALTDEAAKRFETLASKIEIFRNKVKAAAAEVGESLTPAVGDALEKLTDYLDATAYFVKNNPTLVKNWTKLAVAVTAAGVAVGALGIAMKLFGAALTVVTGVTKLVTGFNLLAKAGAAANLTMTLLGRWLLGMPLQLGAITGALGAAAAATVLWTGGLAILAGELYLIGNAIAKTVKVVSEYYVSLSKLDETQKRFLENMVEQNKLTADQAAELAKITDATDRQAKIVAYLKDNEQVRHAAFIDQIQEEAKKQEDRRATTEEVRKAFELMDRGRLDSATATAAALKGISNQEVEDMILRADIAEETNKKEAKSVKDRIDEQIELQDESIAKNEEEKKSAGELAAERIEKIDSLKEAIKKLKEESVSLVAQAEKEKTSLTGLSAETAERVGANYKQLIEAQQTLADTMKTVATDRVDKLSAEEERYVQSVRDSITTVKNLRGEELADFSSHAGGLIEKLDAIREAGKALETTQVELSQRAQMEQAAYGTVSEETSIRIMANQAELQAATEAYYGVVSELRAINTTDLSNEAVNYEVYQQRVEGALNASIANEQRLADERSAFTSQYIVNGEQIREFDLNFTMQQAAFQQQQIEAAQNTANLRNELAAADKVRIEQQILAEAASAQTVVASEGVKQEAAAKGTEAAVVAAEAQTQAAEIVTAAKNKEAEAAATTSSEITAAANTSVLATNAVAEASTAAATAISKAEADKALAHAKATQETLQGVEREIRGNDDLKRAYYDLTNTQKQALADSLAAHKQNKDSVLSDNEFLAGSIRTLGNEYRNEAIVEQEESTKRKQTSHELLRTILASNSDIREDYKKTGGEYQAEMIRYIGTMQDTGAHVGRITTDVRGHLHRLLLSHHESPSILDLWGNDITAFQGGLNTLSSSVDSATSYIRGVWSDFAGWFADMAQGVYDQMQYLNPFARHSPSLVDNTEKGAEEIEDKWTKMARKLLEEFLATHGSLVELFGGLPDAQDLTGGQFKIDNRGNVIPTGDRTITKADGTVIDQAELTKALKDLMEIEGLLLKSKGIDGNRPLIDAQNELNLTLLRNLFAQLEAANKETSMLQKDKIKEETDHRTKIEKIFDELRARNAETLERIGTTLQVYTSEFGSTQAEILKSFVNLSSGEMVAGIPGVMASMAPQEIAIAQQQSGSAGGGRGGIGDLFNDSLERRLPPDPGGIHINIENIPNEETLRALINKISSQRDRERRRG